MMSMQTNLSVSSITTYRSFHTMDKAPGKTGIKNNSILQKTIQFEFQIKTETKPHFSDQNTLFHFLQPGKENRPGLFYNNIPISELSKEQAADLISDDGFFGIDKTSRRITDFVINGAGNDIDRLTAGREGVLRGFAEAEQAWGEKLPDISYRTLEKSLEVIDKKIQALGGAIVDLSM